MDGVAEGRGAPEGSQPGVDEDVCGRAIAAGAPHVHRPGTAGEYAGAGRILGGVAEMNARGGKTPVTVRDMRLEDAGDVAELSGELGYPVSPPDMALRIHAQLQLRHHVTYLACAAAREV